MNQFNWVTRSISKSTKKKSKENDLVEEEDLDIVDQIVDEDIYFQRQEINPTRNLRV